MSTSKKASPKISDREARAQFRQLTENVDQALGAMERAMTMTESRARGAAVASIVNALDLANQVARRYGLGTGKARDLAGAMRRAAGVEAPRVGLTAVAAEAEIAAWLSLEVQRRRSLVSALRASAMLDKGTQTSDVSMVAAQLLERLGAEPDVANVKVSAKGAKRGTRG